MVAACALLVLLQATWLTLRLGGDDVTTYLDNLVPTAVTLLVMVLAGLRARAVIERTARAGWALLSVSMASAGTGQAIYVVYELVLHVSSPFPSVADIAYLAGTVLVLPAVLCLAGPMWRRSGVRMLLDGGVVAIALFLVSWLTVMRTVYEAGASDMLTLAVGLAYPVLDVVTVGIVVSAISYARRVDPVLIVLTTSMLAFAMSDSIFAYMTAVGTYQSPHPIDAGWLAGYLLIGVATLAGRHRRQVDGRAVVRRWQIALPYAPLLIAGLLVAVQLVGHHPLDPVSQVSLAGLIGMVLVRQLMAGMESQSLTIRLNGTVAELEQTSAERKLLIEQAPVGICRLDRDGRLLGANLTLQRMLDYTPPQMTGRLLVDFVHREDRDRNLAAYRELSDGHIEQVETESRFVRRNGSVIWCSQVAGAVRDTAGQPESFIAVVDDVTERRRQGERAAHIQRQLLPQTTPDIKGYDLAGTCLPAQEVAGDFYDWVASADGSIDITVADVMGKGVGAALVMAVLRTAMRSAPASLGPGARVSVAADSLVGGMSDEGLFITLFHARLDVGSGILRYVDAGHGYCTIRRVDGRFVHLSGRSLPLGVRSDEIYREQIARMEPGDTLLVYSDGLVEREDGNLDIREFSGDLDDAEDAGQMVRQLMERVPERPDDDVTLIVLRRLLLPGRLGPKRAATEVRHPAGPRLERKPVLS